MSSTSTSAQDDDLLSQSEEAVAHLVKLKINFLALDFDLTLLDIHTGGRWSGSIDELVQHVRPVFRHFIRAAHSSDIKVAIVTFSPQVGHISRVLEKVFPDFYEHIVIRGRDRSWIYDGNGMTAGKQPFMASAAEEFARKFNHIEIKRCSTLLVDDDPDNIRIALNDGVRGILFDRYRGRFFLDDVKTMP